jgi:hypothetical protein
LFEIKLLFCFGFLARIQYGESLNTRLIAGFILIVLGFLAYQVGFSFILRQTELMIKYITMVVPESYPMDTIGLALQFGGGIVAIIGFLLCVSSLSTRVVTRIQEVKTVTEAPPVVSGQKCRFCGGAIGVDSAFCTVCGKSQK